MWAGEHGGDDTAATGRGNYRPGTLWRSSCTLSQEGGSCCDVAYDLDRHGLAKEGPELHAILEAITRPSPPEPVTGCASLVFDGVANTFGVPLPLPA